jgi:hypothetical protein
MPILVPTFGAEAMFMLEDGDNLTLFIEVKDESVAQPRVWSHFLLLSAQRIVHFSPCQIQKCSFSAAVKAALHAIGIGDADTDFPIFTDCPLEMVLTFRIGSVLKDLNNMMKFAFDALQKVLYCNNRFIFRVVAVKIPVNKDYLTSIEVTYT